MVTNNYTTKHLSTTQARFIRRKLLLLGCLFLFYQCRSQFQPPEVSITELDTVGYTFLNQDNDTLINAHYLALFFSRLFRQRMEGGEKIRIAHIGDSHVQGDFLTREVRFRLQQAFGNAGRGLIFPYKLAHTNGPRDYLVQTPNRWMSSNCQRDLKATTPYGLSGFSLFTPQTRGELTVMMRDSLSETANHFTLVTVFHHDESGMPVLNLMDDPNRRQAQPLNRHPLASTYYFENPVRQFTLRYPQPGGINAPTILDGIVLENEQSGILYHVIGVNGGKFSDFCRARYFAKQLGMLQPDLVILSFGTNEAQANPDSAYICQQIRQLVRLLHHEAPQAVLLFTTPADSYLRGKGYNPHLAKISSIIRSYALENGYALWDLYTLTGGQTSARLWKANGLLSKDSVHYSKPGYAAQGKLLYQSLIRAYNSFVCDQMDVLVRN